jgi:capsule polysaccharide export protein KpsE/RkpR
MIPLIKIVLKHKKVVLLVTIAGFAVSAVVSLILPHRYLSSAALLPAGVEKELTGRGGFFTRLGSFGEAYATLMRMKRNFILEYILRSQRMSDLMSARFHLTEVYGERDPEEVRKRLSEHTQIEVWDEGVLFIAVEDRDPVRSKLLVEQYIHYLDSFLVEMSITDAEAKRDFFERELARRRKRVATLDTAITRYMEVHGVYEIELQVRAALEVAAALSVEISLLEVEKKMLEMTLREGSFELERIDRELEKLQEQLESFVAGKSTDPGVFPSLAELPELAAGYLRLFSEREIQEFAITFINLRLQDAEILERSRVSVIRVIDPPIVPEKRSWPKRKQIVIAATLASFVWVCLVLMAREWWQRDEAAERPAAGGGSEVGGS